MVGGVEVDGDAAVVVVVVWVGAGGTLAVEVGAAVVIGAAEVVGTVEVVGVVELQPMINRAMMLIANMAEVSFLITG